MIKKIDHIGIAVKSLTDAIHTYRKLYGLDAIKIETLQDINVKVAFVPLGEVLIELLEPVKPGEGRIGRFLEEKGKVFIILRSGSRILTRPWGDLKKFVSH